VHSCSAQNIFSDLYKYENFIRDGSEVYHCELSLRTNQQGWNTSLYRIEKDGIRFLTVITTSSGNKSEVSKPPIPNNVIIAQTYSCVISTLI
jgi:hypothetical protein